MLMRLSIQVAVVFSFSLSAFAAGFKTPSGTWSEIGRDGGFQVYAPQKKNADTEPWTSSERMIIQVIELKTPEIEVQGALDQHVSGLSRMREKFMKSVGLNSYTLLEIKKHPLPSNKFRTAWAIDSKFRDLRGNEVYVYERQYEAGGKLYDVQYMVRGKPQLDRKIVDSKLDEFMPKDPVSDRLPASSEPADSELLRATDQLASEPKPADEMSRPENATRLVPNASLCKDVPAEDRRSPSDPTLAQSFKAFGLGCLSGAVSGVVAVLKGAVHGLYSVGKYATDREYYAQTNAMIATAWTEFSENPDEFLMMAGNRLWESIQNTSRDFVCWKSEKQWQAICAVGSGLVSGGLLIKAVLKLPMTAAEIAQVSKVSKSAVEGLKATRSAQALDGPGPARAASSRTAASDVESQLRPPPAESGAATAVVRADRRAEIAAERRRIRNLETEMLNAQSKRLLDQVERGLDEISALRSAGFAQRPPPKTAIRYEGQPIGDLYLGENSGRSALGKKFNVKYLSAGEREAYRAFVKDGVLYGADGMPLNADRAIYVMDKKGNIYVSQQHIIGRFHHSSFLGGAEIASAGHISALHGRILMVDRRSGHYRPERKHLEQFMYELKEGGVNISTVKIGGF